MKLSRIIPRIDIKGPNLVKGVHLEGLRVLGDPAAFAQYYYNHGADELLFMDVVASLYGRNSIHSIISNAAKSIFIPITVGGGIRTLSDITDVLRAGADKVAINTEGLNNPNFIYEAAKEFGSSTIVVTIEAIKHNDNSYYCYTDNGREFTGKVVEDWVHEAQELGCGEFILTSVDREGTGKGLDLELIENVLDVSSVPVIVHGGVGKISDVENVLTDGSIRSIALGSCIHYHAIHEINSTDKSSEIEGNFDFLKSGRRISNIETFSLTTLKEHLHERNIYCR